MDKGRLDEIDILRGFAFLAVVLQHILAGYFTNTGYSVIILSLFLSISRFAVPMFVFITGLVLFYSSKKLSYFKFINRRFSKIFIPYALVTILYYVYQASSNLIHQKNIFVILKDYLFLLVTGKGSYHLWFVIMIFQFYLLIPLFRCVINKNNGFKKNMFILAFSFVVYLVIIYSRSYYIPYINNGLKSTYFEILLVYLDRNFIPWFFYFILGGMAGLYLDEWKRIIARFFKLNIMIYLIGLAPIIYLLLTNKSVQATAWYAEISGPLSIKMVVFLTASIPVLYFIAQSLAEKNVVFSNIIKAFGHHSYGCYLIHAFVLHFTRSFTTTVLGWMNPFLQVMVSFLLCSVICLISMMSISGIKFPAKDIATEAG